MGNDEKGAFKETNYVMFANLPLLIEKKGRAKAKSVVKQLTFEDVYRAAHEKD